MRRRRDGEPRPALPRGVSEQAADAEKPEAPAVVEPIRQSIAEAAEQQSEQRLGSAARRAAILAAVVCVLTLTIAGPVRTYFAQRTEMKQLADAEAQLRSQIADLEQQKVKLGDPVYIAAQARERLGLRDARRHSRTRCSCPRAVPRQRRRGPVRRRCRTANPGTPRCGTPSPMRRTGFRTIPVAPAARRPRCAAAAHPFRRPVVDQADLDAVARQLGREPRGVLEIAYRCPNGEPGVVKTAPRLPDGTPFPTLYYLTHPALTAAASRLESVGLMRDMTERLQRDAELAAAYRRAHESYLAERDAIESLGTTFSGGGMPDRVKCLHVVMAHSLAKGPRRQSLRRRGAGGAGRRARDGGHPGPRGVDR